MSKAGARDWYEDGVADHYREHGASYRNPHAPIIDRCMQVAAARWTLDLGHVLDLAAGSGEFTLAIEHAVGRKLKIDACDAFTIEAYAHRTGRPCERLSFEDIAAGTMRGNRYTLIGCSFAMHLCGVTQLPTLLLELSQIARQLVILSPHKRPIIRDGWGWRLVGSFLEQRVHVRLLESTLEPLEPTPESRTLSQTSTSEP